MRVTLLLFLLCTWNSWAGSGKIIVNTMWDCNEVKASLLLKKEVLQTLSDKDYQEIIFDHLDEGIYDIEIYCDNQLTMTYSSIRVLDGHTTYLENGDKPVRVKNEVYTNEKILPSGNVQLNYGPNQLVDNNQINHSFEFEMHAGLYSNHNQWVHFGYHSGLGYQTTLFHENQTLVEGNTAPLRYTKWFLPLDFSIRIGKADNLQFKNFLFDLGFNYNFPIYFKQVYNSDNQRITTSKIHNFTDFEAYARIGINPVEIQASYRPFNNMRSSFPEEPYIKLGIVYNFSESY